MNLWANVRKKKESLNSYDIFRNENGAIDLSSIMVGIIVIGLIGGIIAATVFVVIPWTQDNAAKQQLDSIVQAENAYYGLSSADPSPLPVGYTSNSFTDSAGLDTAKLLATNPKYCVVTADAGKSFNAFSASASGSIWTSSNSNTKPAKFTDTLPTACEGIKATSGSTPVALPAVNSSKKLRFGVTSNDVNSVATAVGEYPSIVATYKDWKSPFNSAEVQAAYSAGAQPMVTWEPWDANGGANQPTYTLASIYSGQHDAYIQTWITSIKNENTPKPILLRFAHEMNGDWYPWGYQVNGNATGTYDGVNHRSNGDYAKAWRYVHDKFTAAGIDSTKVQWVFAPNATSASNVDYYNFWPGADYVDINGIDGFNWGTKQTWSAWQGPWDVLGGGLWHLNNDPDVSGKPIIITETASVQTEGANSQSQWVRDLVYWLANDANTKNVVGFVYFDYSKVEGSQTVDWRFDATSDGITAMKEELAKRP